MKKIYIYYLYMQDINSIFNNIVNNMSGVLYNNSLTSSLTSSLTTLLRNSINNNISGYISNIYYYCCFSIIMLIVAIYRCGDIMEYFVACTCPCLYLCFLINKTFRKSCSISNNNNNKIDDDNDNNDDIDDKMMMIIKKTI